MSLCVSDIIDRFNASLTQQGYRTTGSTTPAQPQKPDTTFTKILDVLQGSGTPNGEQSASRTHTLLGTTKDGLPVVGSDEATYAADITKLAAQAVARGQDEDGLNFILANVPVFDGPTGPLVGYEMRAAVELTGFLPLRDVSK